MISAVEFRNKYIGLAIDVDGAAGVQCVDLFKQCCYLAGKGAFALDGSGYACEIAKRFDVLGLGAYFDRVSLDNAQYGDWLVWDRGSAECPDSHVAMFERWNGSKVYVLGQNQFGQSKATEGNISASGIIGVLRLKAWIQQPKKTNDQIAQEVLNGSWGNGEDRKKRLTDAGYNYDAVQAIVNHYVNGSSQLPKKSVDTIAKEVINGAWGNGADRQNRLEKAGYNFQEVQNKVNQILNGSKKSIDTIAYEVINGNWGNGQDRINRLKAAGYDPVEVQNRVNQLV